MKKDASVSTSGSGNGIKAKVAAAAFVSMLFLAFQLTLHATGSSDLRQFTVAEIYLRFDNTIRTFSTSPFRELLHINKGDRFNLKAVRKSMENLYKTGSVDNVEVKVRELQSQGGNKLLALHFLVTNKYVIESIKIRQELHFNPLNPLELIIPPIIFSSSDLKQAIFSMREQTYFEEDKISRGVNELTQFLRSRGYLNPRVTHDVARHPERSTVSIKFYISSGKLTRVGRIEYNIALPELIPRIRSLLKTKNYIPLRFNQKLEEVRQYLKKKEYYFPVIDVKEHFTDDSKQTVNLTVTVDPGYKYRFQFQGMTPKTSLISNLWQKKVFEIWAEKESNARILYFLKNKGFLDAQVDSRITDNPRESVKTITFDVKKNKKYRLGKVYFEGNHSIAEDELRKVIQLDDLAYEKFFHLRLRSILVDREVLRIYYYFKGFPSTRIVTRPEFRNGRADIRFIIDEGRQYTVESILFDGNKAFTTETLLRMMKTRVNKPFVQQQLKEDIEAVRTLYHRHGFNKIVLTPEVSPGTEKSILVRFSEGSAYRMGSLITIGAARGQRKLLERLFPMKPGDAFNQLKVDTFQQEIENSSLFNQFKIAKIERPPDFFDVLIRVNPDYSKYYGVGIGYEERQGFRGTLEYQGRNAFRSYSTLSAMVQAGPNYMRGVISYDTPYFFNNRISSALKIWADNEIYPSYEFERFGIGESLIKNLKADSYLMASLSWYRTTLKDLEITPQGFDQLNTPFDTTALNLSYVRERRDDPFNPSEGTFFSANLKVGLPLFEKDYSFVKFRLNFQDNLKFLRNGVFTFSFRSGLASGEMSITERFFAGGSHSFRGVRTDRLGPIDPISRKPTGGNALVMFNLEATFPLQLLPVDGLYYSLYADIGNVFEKVRLISLKEMKTTIGFSIKWKMPLGMLWTGVAYNLDAAPGKKYPLIVLGIGNVF